MARNRWGAILDTDCVPCKRARQNVRSAAGNAVQGNARAALSEVSKAVGNTGRSFTMKAGKITANFTRGK